MQNSACLQKSIVPASVKTQQIKLLYQQQSSLIQEASRISSITPLENKVPTVIKCSVLLPDN